MKAAIYVALRHGEVCLEYVSPGNKDSIRVKARRGVPLGKAWVGTWYAGE